MSNLTPEAEAFCREVVKFEKQLEGCCNSLYECYAKAYKTKDVDKKIKSLYEMSSRKHSEIKIQSRIAELRKEIGEELIYSAKESFNEFERLKNLAEKEKRYNDCIKAEHLKGDLANLYVKTTKELNPSKTIVVASKEDKEMLEDL